MGLKLDCLCHYPVLFPHPSVFSQDPSLEIGVQSVCPEFISFSLPLRVLSGEVFWSASLLCNFFVGTSSYCLRLEKLGAIVKHFKQCVSKGYAQFRYNGRWDSSVFESLLWSRTKFSCQMQVINLLAL